MDGICGQNHYCKGVKIMNIDEIKRNAPEGCTHYRFLYGEVQYLKKLSYHDSWYIWFELRNEWMPTFWSKVKVGDDIKPL